MAVTITHSTVVDEANDPNFPVSKNAWNDEHTVEITDLDIFGPITQITDGENSYFDIYQYSDGGFGPWMYVTTSRGTAAAPAAVQEGDWLWGITVFGNDGDYNQPGSASIRAEVDGPVSNGVIPVAWVINTGNGAVNYGRETLRATSAGAIGIGGALPAAGEKVVISLSDPGDADFATAFFGYSDSGSGGVSGYFALEAYHNDAYGPDIYLGYGRGSTSSRTIVQNGDSLGAVVFQGWDGTIAVNAAHIRVLVDGTPGANDVPGAMVFSTRLDGGASAAERLRITNAGHGIWRSATATPPTLANNGDWVLTPTSNTNMRISYRGSDGLTKTANITLS